MNRWTSYWCSRVLASFILTAFSCIFAFGVTKIILHNLTCRFSSVLINCPSAQTRAHAPGDIYLRGPALYAIDGDVQDHIIDSHFASRFWEHTWRSTSAITNGSSSTLPLHRDSCLAVSFVFILGKRTHSVCSSKACRDRPLSSHHSRKQKQVCEKVTLFQLHRPMQVNTLRQLSSSTGSQENLSNGTTSGQTPSVLLHWYPLQTSASSVHEWLTWKQFFHFGKQRISCSLIFTLILQQSTPLICRHEYMLTGYTTPPCTHFSHTHLYSGQHSSALSLRGRT